MKNPCLAAAIEELAKAGIHHPQIVQGGKHLQLRWTSPTGQLRVVGVSRTPSHQQAESGRSCMTDDDSKNRFHPDNLRMDVGEVRAIVPRKIRRRREQFVLVPGIWKERLTKVKYAATYRVALHILMRDFETGGKLFTLSNGALALENVSRWQKWRALSELEAAGLVTVERCNRKTPQITVLLTGGNPADL
jgi:hypothetical protein